MSRRLNQPIALSLIGLPGVLSLLLVLPELPGVPKWALLINPTVLLVTAACAGTWAAKRCGLRLSAAPVMEPKRAVDIGAGVLIGVVVALADHSGRALWQGPLGMPPSIIEGWSATSLLVGLLYGGVVEEIVFRWGLMSLVVLALWRILARRAVTPSTGVLLAGVSFAALIFAASHLPAVAATGAELLPSVALRTLLLNTLVGLLYGWLFVRRDLIAAIAAHAGTHLGFAAAALLSR